MNTGRVQGAAGIRRMAAMLTKPATNDANMTEKQSLSRVILAPVC